MISICDSFPSSFLSAAVSRCWISRGRFRSCCMATMRFISWMKLWSSARVMDPDLSWSTQSNTISNDFLAYRLLTFLGSPSVLLSSFRRTASRLSARMSSLREMSPSWLASTAWKSSTRASSLRVSARWARATSAPRSNPSSARRLAARAWSSSRRFTNSTNSPKSMPSFPSKSIAAKIRLLARSSTPSTPSSSPSSAWMPSASWTTLRRAGSRARPLAISARVTKPSWFMSRLLNKCRRVKKALNSSIFTAPSCE
mmetsp:Transcript_37501/g.83871  ORF Transcript_37501/g.83871 Transcript_37501/m.83871 type:complete len:256 (-) Transcript_37501:290-1057(-)